MMAVGRHIFPPESFAAPYRTVPIAELSYALVGKQLGRVWRPKRAMGKTRPPTDKTILRATYLSDAALMADLCSGALIAHVYIAHTGHFRRITTRYWKDELSGASLGGFLIDIESNGAFDPDLEWKPIIVCDTNAEEWLSRNGISEEEIYFPEELRPQIIAKSVPRETLYDWPTFETQVCDRLHYEGGYLVSWQQRHLVNEMIKWCEENWGEDSVPDVKMLRSHVKLAHTRFLQEKKRNERNHAYTPG